jgi:hypothetical protein
VVIFRIYVILALSPTLKRKGFVLSCFYFRLKPFRPIHFPPQVEIKANYVKKVIRTIKLKMYRYFTHAQSYNYIEELQKFADNYNQAFHRTRWLKGKKPTCSSCKSFNLYIGSPLRIILWVTLNFHQFIFRRIIL